MTIKRMAPKGFTIKLTRKVRPHRPHGSSMGKKIVSRDRSQAQTWPVSYGLLSPPTNNNNDKQRSIRSIEIGFRLIRCLEMASRLLSLRELADTAGMSPSKAHFYLVSFRRIGLVYREEATGRYGLGPYAAQLGLVALNRMDVVALSKEPMLQLVERTGEASFLSVWGNHGPCIVSKVDGPRFVPMVLRVGYTLPLIDTATGRVFLAFMPNDATDAVLQKERREKSASSHHVSLTHIQSLIEDVRSKGLARNDSTVNEGFVAIAAPVFDHSDVICAVITLIGPSGLMKSDEDGENERALRQTAGRISRLLGFSGPAS